MLQIRHVSLLFLLLLACPVFGDSTSIETQTVHKLVADGPIVEIRNESDRIMRIRFLADDVFRIESSIDGELRDAKNGKAPIVLPWKGEAPALHLTEHGTHHKLRTAAAQLTVWHEPLRLELHRVTNDQVGELLWRELRPLVMTEDGTVQTLSSNSEERFYGGGQQNGAFQFKGRLMPISYSGGWDEGDRPSPAPFFMSHRGYGMLRNTWSDGSYDFRSDGYLTTFHAEPRFDAYVMVADSIHGVLKLYTRLTGRARLLPRWALGYGDADCYNDGDNSAKPGTVPEGWTDGPTGKTPDVVEVARQYRAHDMPGAWILPNDGYGCGYEDLPEVVDELEKLGFRTGLWTEDGVEKIAWEVGEAGTRVQKLDVAWTGKGYQWAMDANHDAASGILTNSSSRPVVWTVRGWAGIQRYAVTWTGDQTGSWDFIRWHVPTLIGSGLSGMSYSTADVDGIFGGSPELYTRDLQWKSFIPVLMGMSGWSKIERKHPWWHEEPHRSIHRKYLKLRQRLVPYLYTLARETEESGTPMVRGIGWDHPNDPHTDDFPYQFFLGRDLLIAPVYQSQKASDGRRENIYLPQGRWIDFWDGTVLDAGPNGRVIGMPVGLEKLPILVRAGAILPMYPESLYDGEVAPDPLTLDIYPAVGAEPTEFVLYEDDGNTREYQEGRFSTQRIKSNMSPDGDRMEIHLGAVTGEFDGILESRRIELAIHTPTAPTQVRLGDVDLPHLSSTDVLSKADSGFAHDVNDRGGVLWIRTGTLDVRQNHHVRIDFEGSARPAAGEGYPAGASTDIAVPTDALRVVGRPAEEPGHPLENAFDGDPNTWFRTLRDSTVAYGAPQITLFLGERRLIEGFRISPRNDKHWEHGQIRDYAVFLSDDGTWGEPIATGRLEKLESEQEVRFPARAGRLLRLEVRSTHNDPEEAPTGPYDATEAVRVYPIAVSELRLLEARAPDRPPLKISLSSSGMSSFEPVQLGGLTFERGLRADGTAPSLDYSLDGYWHTLKAEVGLDDRHLTRPDETARFQVWGDGRLLWDSRPLAFNPLPSAILKPRIDIRGVEALSLRITGSNAGAWADVELIGFEGDSVTPKN